MVKHSSAPYILITCISIYTTQVTFSYSATSSQLHTNLPNYHILLSLLVFIKRVIVKLPTPPLSISSHAILAHALALLRLTAQYYMPHQCRLAVTITDRFHNDRCRRQLSISHAARSDDTHHHIISALLLLDETAAGTWTPPAAGHQQQSRWVRVPHVRQQQEQSTADEEQNGEAHLHYRQHVHDDDQHDGDEGGEFLQFLRTKMQDFENCPYDKVDKANALNNKYSRIAARIAAAPYRWNEPDRWSGRADPAQLDCSAIWRTVVLERPLSVRAQWSWRADRMSVAGPRFCAWTDARVRRNADWRRPTVDLCDFFEIVNYGLRRHWMSIRALHTKKTLWQIAQSVR